MEDAILEQEYEPASTVTELSVIGEDSQHNSDLPDNGQADSVLPDNGQADSVLPETVLCRAGTWGRRCYKYAKDNKWLSLASTSLILCMLGNWVLMDVLIRNFRQDVKQGLVLNENTSSQWLHPGPHSYISFYLFKISVPDNDVPTVSESGPYVYRFEVQKVSVTWNNNSTVSYREHWTLFYDRTRSAGEEPSHLTDLAFATLFQRNESVGPMWNVYTGQSDFSSILQTYSFNYTTNPPIWSSTDGNHRITGTDGSRFQPGLTEDVPLTLFYPKLHRTFELGYSGLITYRDLSVYRYIIANSAFVSSSTSCNPGNNTWDAPMAGETSCVPPGLYSVQTEMDGMPLYISLPHFLGADAYYHHAVKGLDPQEDKHRPFFDVDKVTGKTVRQKRRFQVTLRETPGDGRELYLPLYWAELSQEVGDDDLASIRRAREYPDRIRMICMYVGTSFGLLLAAILSSHVYKAVTQHMASSQYRQLNPGSGRQCCKRLKWF